MYCINFDFLLKIYTRTILSFISKVTIDICFILGLTNIKTPII